MTPELAMLARRCPGNAEKVHRRKGGIVAVKDPVCAMVIEEADAVGTSEHEGKTYHFCSMDCKEEFDENPEDYAD